MTIEQKIEQEEIIIQCQTCGYLTSEEIYELPEGWTDAGGLWSCGGCSAASEARAIENYWNGDFSAVCRYD